MENLLLNIDYKQQQGTAKEAKPQKNKDKYKKNKQKIIDKKQQRREKHDGYLERKPFPQVSEQSKQIIKDKPQLNNKEQVEQKKEQKKEEKKEYEKKVQPPKEEEPKAPEVQEAEVFSVDKFEELPINDKLKEMLKANNFEKMTKIQKSSIPVILKTQNVVLKSETGSGKTLAYLVPLLEYLSYKSLNEEKINRENGTYCIIFCPSRELCLQIDLELKRLLKLFYYVVAGTITGGEDPKKEKARLRKGMTVIICTPGRFLYHLQNTQSLNLSHLSYLIFDEADRMLDMGFEREMNQCLQVIKKKCIDKYKQPDNVDNYWTDKMKINFVSATLSKRVESLGAKLMENYETVGFDVVDEANEDIQQIPKQIQQFYIEIPTQFRLLYLIAFLYTHQHEKVIVFASNCELVNFIYALLNTLDWNTFGVRDDDGNKQEEEKKQLLCDGHIYKLNGDMDHAERKQNFFGFDKADHSVLICTDVASRGLDFKHVEWIVQYDLSSQIKDYVNRVGRTARIATSGSSLAFVMPSELGYVDYMKNKHGIEMYKKDRFTLIKNFQKKVQEKSPKMSFKLLKSIEDYDEQQEAIHKLRFLVREAMQNENNNLLSMAQIAKNSSTRAYAGHGHEMRSIFDINNLNLTEFARSFALYKNLAQRAFQAAKQPVEKKNDKKRSFKDRKEEKEQVKEEVQMFSKRLLKAKQKELERKIDMTAEVNEKQKLRGELMQVKKAVYTDEDKVNLRKQNFEKAKHSVGKKVLDEFM